MKTIVLTGMMGSGKSSVGKLLAKYCNVEFIDIDDKIVQSQKISISEIFTQKGESYFRELEALTINTYFEKENKVIALGGGAFENNITRDFLLDNSVVIYLDASPEVIYERIKSDTSRPLLNGNMSIEKISQILNLREQNYKTAQIIINTNEKNHLEIVKEIIGVI